MQPGGVITAAAFLIFSFILVAQIVVFEKNRRKYRKLLDEGKQRGLNIFKIVFRKQLFFIAYLMDDG